VDDKHKQKGYMSEALPEVLRFGFESMLLNRIQAMVANDNTPSVKLLQKHGFVWEGTCRQDYLVESVFEDSECYSLLKHEWAQNRI
jgi:ribosomal-protein-alanine N-acetyltransferase